MRNARNAWVLPAVFAFARGAWAAELGEDALDPARITAIAAMLPARPTGVGRPVTDRAAWAKLAEDAGFRKFVGQAEKLLDRPIPEPKDEDYLAYSRTGRRGAYMRGSWRRTSCLKTLALAECVEDKGRFIPQLEKVLGVICGEKTWVMPPHDGGLKNFNGESISIDLSSSAMGWNLASVHYLLGTRLGEETRQRLRETLNQRILDPFRDMVTGKRARNWWIRGRNNWNAVCMSGVIGTALAMLDSREDRALFVAAAEHYSTYFLKGFTADGYCSEGVGYWNYGFGHYVLLAETIHQATAGRIDMLAWPEARAPATFGAKIEIIDGVCPAFADCGVKARPSRRIMWFVNRRFGVDDNSSAGRVSTGGALSEALLNAFPNSASLAPPGGQPLPEAGIRSWFADAGILIGRPAAGGACRMGVALKGGHNGEHHNHNDVGSYVVVVGASPVLLDPGSEVYTSRTFSSRRYESRLLSSYGHPVPVVAGRLQRKGSSARGVVLAADFSDERDVFALDLRSAYDVPECTKLERRFEYSRQGAGSLSVTDTAEFSTPQPFGTALITLGYHKELGPGKLLVYDSDGAVTVEIRSPAGDFALKAERIEEEMHGARLPTRLGIDLAQPVRQASICVTIKPTDPSPKKPGHLLANGDFELEGWGWHIRDKGISTRSDEQAASGQYALKIADADAKRGSDVSSAPMPVETGTRDYVFGGKVFPVSGKGLAMYVKYLDGERKTLNAGADGRMTPLGELGGTSGRWEPFSFAFTVPEQTACLQVWIHSLSAAKVEAFLDDLHVVAAKR
ncbi:MAG: heparinase II/III family protein [Kiritimatiellae bacterium]|nr:heparinase II/III family protein [Kiritimatiellia bacterium]